MRQPLMIIAFKCCCFHAAFTFTLLWNSYSEREAPFVSCTMQKKEHLNQMCCCCCCCLTPSFSIIHWSDSLTFFSCTDPLTHCSVWEQVVKCLALPILHPSIFMPPSFRPYHLASHLWQDTREQLPGPDLYLSYPLSWPSFLPSSHLWLSLTPSLPASSYLCSGLCSVALRPCQNWNTPWFLSLRSL